MADIKKELAEMLNKALTLEQAARIQYLTHAELVSGADAEPVIARLKEIASDEAKHEEKFRTLVANYLGCEPTMAIGEVHRAKGIREILETNLRKEKDAIVFYKQIHKKVVEDKDALKYELETLEHEIRHVLIDEQEHVVELSVLLGLI
jgi:bacterioferritin (cytochrome b1)